MIEAGLEILNFIKPEIELVTGNSWSYYPGAHASGNARDEESYGLYECHQGRDYWQPYIHRDRLVLKVLDPSYLNLQRTIETLLEELNQESPYSLDFYTTSRSSGFLFQQVEARVSGQAHNEFIDGVEYFSAIVDIIYSYSVSGGTVRSGQGTQLVYLS